MSETELTYMSNNASLPQTGFVRLPSIIGPGGPIPVSKSTWWQGIRSGRYPKPVKLGPRITAWRVEDIRALIDAAAERELHDGSVLEQGRARSGRTVAATPVVPRGSAVTSTPGACEAGGEMLTSSTRSAPRQTAARRLGSLDDDQPGGSPASTDETARHERPESNSSDRSTRDGQ